MGPTIRHWMLVEWMGMGVLDGEWIRSEAAVAATEFLNVLEGIDAKVGMDCCKASIRGESLLLEFSDDCVGACDGATCPEVVQTPLTESFQTVGTFKLIFENPLVRSSQQVESKLEP